MVVNFNGKGSLSTHYLLRLQKIVVLGFTSTQHKVLSGPLVRGQLHIAGCATDIGHGSIYGNWQGIRVGHVKDLRICHRSAMDLLQSATVPQGQVCG